MSTHPPDPEAQPHDPPTPAVPPPPHAPSHAPSADAPGASGPARDHPFAFTGNAREYFRIWVVNLLLSVLTVGLWSPWAKVRRRRYFYGHTWVAGANFEYHANPMVILRGRLIAAAAVVVYWIVENFRPGAGPWMLLVLLAGLPWIVARSLAFNAANSSHRGIRFAFGGRTRDVVAAMWPLLLAPIALILVEPDAAKPASGGLSREAVREMATAALLYAIIGLLYPWVVARVRRLAIRHSRWGRAAFVSTLKARSVYRIYLLAGLIGALMGGVLGGGVGAVSVAVGKTGVVRASGIGTVLALIAFGFVYAIVVSTVAGYTRSRITNLTFETARLDGHARFRSTLRARRLASMYLGNAMAIVASVGLLIPWAVVRVARYRAESLVLVAETSVDDVLADGETRITATGEELAEAFGFDLAV